MEAQFSDTEFSDILEGFASIDDMLIGWDIIMTDDDGAASGDTQSLVDLANGLQQEPAPTGSPLFMLGTFADEIISSTAVASLGVGAATGELGATQLHDSESAQQQSPRLDGASRALPLSFLIDNDGLQTLFQAPSAVVQQLTGSIAACGAQHAQPPGRSALIPAEQATYLNQHWQQHQPAEPALPYLVQTPSSTCCPEPTSCGATGSGSHALARVSVDASTYGATATAPSFSGVSGHGAVSEYDGDGCSSALPAPVVAPPQSHQGFGGSTPPPPCSLPQWAPGSLMTTTADGCGTVDWARLPPGANLSAGLAASATVPATVTGLALGTGACQGLSQSNEQTPNGGGDFPGAAGVSVAPAAAIPSPSSAPVPSAAAASAPPVPEPPAVWKAGQQGQPGIGAGLGLGLGGVAPGPALRPGLGGDGDAGFAVRTTALQRPPQAWDVRFSLAAAAPGASGRVHSVAAAVEASGTAPSSAAAAAATGAGASVAAGVLGFRSGIALPMTTSTAGGAVTTAATAAGGPRATGGVCGSTLLAELVAEAAGPGWAAVATGLAPLPPGEGRTAEELLAGLDLHEVFAPPKTSHAKRIRGHVRRAAELRAQLADRVRAIQRLAAENADLRGRAKVLELVVRCRDEHLRLLRNYRTSADGRRYYVGQPGLLGDVTAGGGGGEEHGDGGNAALVAVPYIGTDAAALAIMPAAGLLEMLRHFVADVTHSLAAAEAAAAESKGAAGATAVQAAVAARGQRRTCGSLPSETAPAAAAGPPAAVRLDSAAVAVATVVGGGDSSSAPYGNPLARLRHQMALFRNLLRYLGLVNEEACKLAGTALTGEAAAPEPIHWLRVVQGLGLNAQQLADAAALHACWQDWLARIHAERRSLAAALDELLSVNRYGATYFESVGQYGTDRDAIHNIHANVMRERILVLLTAEVFCGHTQPHPVGPPVGARRRTVVPVHTGRTGGRTCRLAALLRHGTGAHARAATPRVVAVVRTEGMNHRRSFEGGGLNQVASRSQTTARLTNEFFR